MLDNVNKRVVVHSVTWQTTLVAAESDELCCSKVRRVTAVCSVYIQPPVNLWNISSFSDWFLSPDLIDRKM